MDKIIKGLIGFSLLTFASLVHADTFEYGFLPVVGFYKSSVDKDTEVLADVNVLSGLLIINSGRNSRIWTQAQYHSLDFDGSKSKIGERVKGFEIAMLYQSNFRVSRHFKPWLGVGISVATLKFKDRYIKDDQGFLDRRFDNKTKTGLAVDFNFTTETNWFDDYDTGFSFRLSVPTNDVLAKAEAGFYITF